MKKLISAFTLVMLLAFAGSASATTILFEEDFAHKNLVTTNWDFDGGGTAYANGNVFNYTTNSDNKPLTSLQSFELSAGNTYTLLVNSFHSLLGQKERDLTLQLVSGKNILAEITGGVGYDDLIGHGKGTDVVLTFDAKQDYSDVHLVIWLGKKNVAYRFEKIQFSSDLTPSNVPLPGAAFLLLPGLAGIGMIRSRLQ